VRLIPLGTNGYFPSFGRQTMSFLVLTGSQALLLDAGTGVSRLIEPDVAALVTDYRELDIVLSHYHLDHVIGLSHLPTAWPHGRIRLYAPAPPMLATEPEAALERLMSPPLFPASFRSFPGRFEVIRACETLEIGELTLRLWPQRHPGGSVGIRLGDEIAYVTDTAVDLDNAEKVAGVDLLLHELWSNDEEAALSADRGHSHVTAVAEFAKAAKVGRLMPVHHHPKRSEAEIRDMSCRLASLPGIPAVASVEGQVMFC